MLNKRTVLMGGLFLLTLGLGAQPLGPLTATSLTGRSTVVPVSEKVTVLVVSFSQKGGEGTKVWGERFVREFGTHPRVACYAVAVLAAVPGPLRGMVVGFIQGSTPVADRGRFLTTFTDEDAWKTAAGFRGPDDTYVVIVDPRGTVVRTFHEPFSEGAYVAAAEVVRSLAGAAP